MLSVHEVESGYGLVPVLHGVSLEVAPGEIVAVLGPNGAGKSTLLRTISGLLTLRSGSISVGSARIDGLPPHRVARLGVAHVVEGRGILPNLTIRENLLLGSFLHGSRDGEKQRLDAALDQFPWMRPRLSDLGGRLSGGQQQMLAIARALVGDPSVLLLDEPSLGLAPLVIDELFEVIGRLATGERAVLIVEQHVHRCLEVATRGYVLQRGRMVLADTAETLRADERIEQAYLS
ncbi:ABC transporter ATP-binding protein [Pseudonocardia sp. N23]|uniref:ABC transporter ATP-binding protein n=1 Tax=Pseudonocardia sp. N23 TaxID=1987376 RepID=UPI000BFB69B8|nr:ABC transporter ATP-binding protein [Pseudonocardia sp. N23]GAY10991.1 branched-chain amino acid transport ATP-binding protein LivF [Pseudonocardia sp. N23]